MYSVRRNFMTNGTFDVLKHGVPMPGFTALTFDAANQAAKDFAKGINVVGGEPDPKPIDPAPMVENLKEFCEAQNPVPSRTVRVPASQPPKAPEPEPAPEDTAYAPNLDATTYGKYEQYMIPQLREGYYTVCTFRGQPRRYADSESLHVVMVDPNTVTEAQIKEWATKVWPDTMGRRPYLGSYGFDGIYQTHLDGRYFKDGRGRMCWVVRFRSIFTD